MAEFLRMVRQGRWSHPTWVRAVPKQWQADALGDLGTQKNALSVFLVDNKQTTDQVVAGLAATRKNLTNLDYTIIDSILLTNLNIRTEQQRGDTPHSKANCLHHNIVDLTAINVLMLAQSIPPENVIRVPWKEVGKLVKNGIDEGFIDKQSVSQEILDRIY